MAPSKLRKALGAVKDQTSISLAKVASNNAPDLDVAIVKATSHDEIPIDEKYVYAILHLTSYSRGYVNACVYSLSKRIGKTHNWVVAIKALMLIHRLFQDGDPHFEQEVLQGMRRGGRLLNLSNFRDDSHSDAWDYTAFVRTYALYLDERLECSLLGKYKFADKNKDQRPRSRNEYEYRGGYEYSDGRHSTHGGASGSRSSYDDFGDYGSSRPRPRYGDYDEPGQGRGRGEENGQKDNAPVAVRDMKPDMVLDGMSYWQKLLERFLACRPTGASRNHRLVHVALYNLVRESFQLYKDITDGLAILLDAYFDMEYQDCVSTFDFYTRASKQIDELASFYGLTKNIGVCRSSEYPDVQKISEKLLETLETFLQDRSRNNRLPAPEPMPVKQEPVEEAEPVEDMNSIKALPAPGDDVEKEPEKPKVEVPKVEVQEKEADLLNLNQATISTEEHENQFALALFTGNASTSTVTSNWEAFSSEGPQSSGVTSAWQTPAAEGKEGWELALAESASNLSKQQNTMSRGFDPLLLDGLYDQAAAKQQYNPYTQVGSASSMVMPTPQQLNAQYLALPAPPVQGGAPATMALGGDPFAASLAVPPPAYVQMSDITKKQQMLLQEQQLWQQYQTTYMPHRYG